MIGGPSHWLHVRADVDAALQAGHPVVALESAVFSHGLPPEASRRLAVRLQSIMQEGGVTSALVALKDGRAEVGASLGDLDFLFAPGVLKVAERDLAFAVAQGRCGGTTVSGTLAVAHAAGLRIMTTGGIGGVHLDAGATGDISADLAALSRHPLVVICAGAKAFCDARRTAEALDSLGITVVGYRTDTLPAFLARSSGVPVAHRVERAGEVAAIAQAKSRMRDRSALLVVQPPPVDAALDEGDLDEAVSAALHRARGAAVSGADVTPFLLRALADITNGRSLAANLVVLEENARLAAAVAFAMVALERVGGATGQS